MFNKYFESSKNFEGVILRNSFGDEIRMTELEYSVRKELGRIPEGFKRVTIIYEDDSPLVKSIKRKLIDEEYKQSTNSSVRRVSKYDLKRLFSYHKREISSETFRNISESLKGINYAEMVDTIDELQNILKFDRMKSNHAYGMDFIHVWYKTSGAFSWYHYTLTFDESQKLVKVDCDL